MSTVGQKQITVDDHLLSAGQCFMFLCWVESAMRDLLVLHKGGREVRLKYNSAYGVTGHPREFSRKRMEMCRLSFGRIKNEFLAAWPRLKDDANTHDAIERVVIYRNGFGHAQIQPFRQYLLYTPTTSALRAIQEFTRCPACLRRHKNCRCQREYIAEPVSLVFRCLDGGFLSQLYGDIQTVDEQCLLPIAKEIDVAYQGVAWPKDDGHALTEHRPVTNLTG